MGEFVKPSKQEIDDKLEIAGILTEHLNSDVSKVLDPLYQHMQKKIKESQKVNKTVYSENKENEGLCVESLKGFHECSVQCDRCKNF